MLSNGVPSIPCKCKRGVRQGDPLSALLFVLVTDLLQSMINRASTDGLLIHPLENSFGGDYLIVQYADDTLVVMPTDKDQLLCLQSLLQTFARSTGLKLNFSKSSLIPINVEA